MGVLAVTRSRVRAALGLAALFVILVGIAYLAGGGK
jgi:hypothetical protein